MRVFDDDKNRKMIQSSSEPSLLMAAVIRTRGGDAFENEPAQYRKHSENSSSSPGHEMPTLIRMSSADLFTPPVKVLAMLIERGLFRDARDYAKTAVATNSLGIDSSSITNAMIHDVTFAEVRAMLEAFQSCSTSL